MKKLVLFGAGGFGRETANLVEWINILSPTYELLGFIVEKEYYKPDMNVNGYPVLGTEDWFFCHPDVLCTCTVGIAKEKARIQMNLSSKGVKFETLKAPDVLIPSSSRIGEGCIFFRDVAISVNVVVGNGVFLNCGVTLGHDTQIGDYVSVMPNTGISGYCHIEEQVDIGGHAFLIPARKVGKNAKIAAGSIVFTNVKAGTTVLGNPAKRMKALEG